MSTEPTKPQADARTAYFVMLRHPNGFPMPLLDGNESDEFADVPLLFASEAEAERVVGSHDAAQAWGYEVYPWTR